MAKKANASVKFFLEAKKAVVTVVVEKRKGAAKVASAAVYVNKKGREVDAGSIRPRRFSIKDQGDIKHVGYLLVIPFGQEDGTTEPGGDAIDIEIPTARVRVTITNQPPASDPPDVEIDETEDNPQDEPGDDPTGPFAFFDEE